MIGCSKISDSDKFSLMVEFFKEVVLFRGMLRIVAGVFCTN